MFGLIVSSLLTAPQDVLVYEAPAGSEYAQVVAGGRTILPNGRFVTPKGKRLYTKENLWSVATLPDGRVMGLSEGGFSIYDPSAPKPERTAVDRKENAFCYAILPKRGEVVVSTGDLGGVEILDLKTMEVKATISANAGIYRNSYINDLAASPDGKLVYGVDVAHQRVVVFDLEEKLMVESEPAGRQPYALEMSKDGKKLFVANIGIFNYSLIPPDPAGKRRISRPPFAFPSKESETGVQMEGRFIPGIGSPYVADAQSVFVYDLSQPKHPKFKQSAKAGILIHAPADGGKSVGGSAPNDLLVVGKNLYVSCANNDLIQIFDAATMQPKGRIKLTPSPTLSRFRGVIPSGMVADAAGKTLYVSESGINSIAVIDIKSSKVMGRIPTGWFPTGLNLSADGKTLYAATQKGIGRGPTGEFHPRLPGDERIGFTAMPGMIDAIPLPDSATLKTWSKEVLINNGLLPIKSNPGPKVFPRVPGKGSDHIKYVVFITKENHTFDGIFGELKSRGAKSEPRYAEFGRQGWIREKGKAEKVPIMPNHLALADQFSISDNFYMEPQASGDGHRWLVGVYPSLWTTRVFYSGWDYRPVSNAQGRFVSFGSYGSQFPEDYLENGSIWEHISQGGLTFRNYGEGYEMPRGYQDRMNNRTGVEPVMNHPMPKVLFDNTDFDFPAYNTWIPDIARADWFQEDIEQEIRAKGKPLPRFINIAICNDHGDSPRPKDGYPYTASYMADNDLALGRIVEYLSHTPEWKNMAIFVTQDDSGGDADSVDRHRSFVLAIGPYCKKGYISKRHTSIMSIIKSIYLLHGLPPSNMFDAVASDLRDMFTDKPDFTPYKHVPADPRVFKPEDTVDVTDPKFERRRRESRPVKMDDAKFIEWLRNGGTGQYKKGDDDD